MTPDDLFYAGSADLRIPGCRYVRERIEVAISDLTDALRLVENLMFVALGVVALRKWHRSRGRAELWLAIAFGTMASVIVIGLFLPQTLTHSVGLTDPLLWEYKVLVGVVFVFPYFLFRFQAALYPPRRSVEGMANGATLLMILATLALPRLFATNDHRRPWWLIVYLVVVAVQWTTLSVVVARRLWIAGRGQPRVARRRMQLLSLGSATLLLALVPAAFTSNATPGSVARLAGQLIGIMAAVLFAVGFVPPSILRVMWRRPEEEALRRAEARLMEAMTAEEVASGLLPQLAAMLGGHRAALLNRTGTTLGTYGFSREEVAELAPAWRDVRESDGPTMVRPGLVVAAIRTGWIVVETGTYSPFFGRDEASIIVTLAAFIDLALTRADLFDREATTRLQLVQRATELERSNDELALLSAIAANMAEGVILTRVADGTILYTNACFDSLFGYGAHELEGRNVSLLEDPASRRDELRAELQSVVTATGFWTGELQYVKRDGTSFWSRVNVSMLHHAEQGQVWIAVHTDVTARKRAEDALLESEDRLAEAQHIARVGSWEWEVASDTSVWSDELYRLLGAEVGEFTPSYLAYVGRVHPEDRTRFHSVVYASTETGEPFAVDHRVELVGGQVRWLRVQGRVETTPDDLIRVVGTAQDVTEQREAEEALAHQALHDPLTGLPNRALLLDRLEQALARRGKDRGSLAVLFLDVDRFKWVNDSLGHTAGDVLLVELARRLSGAARSGDTVARFGGDEFVVVCEDGAGGADAAHLAERFAAAISTPVVVAGTELTPTVSIGIVEASPSRPADAAALIRDADTAMYQAKERGRNCYELFGASTRARVSERLELESMLRRAIDNGELAAFYQPVMNLASSSVAGVEALARWLHPDRGMIPPSRFIPVAEETGLIVPLGAQIFEIACHQAAAWERDSSRPRSQAMVISINLSARQLLAPGLVSMIERVLDATGLPPTSICVEITETVLLADVDATAQALRSLKDLGVLIAVDDFGTGYSSLLYLKRLPVDDLKIDQSFVQGLGHSPEDRAIVTSVIDLAHAFGISTTAEGVETPEQLTVLRELGCERAQGYNWSPAMPAIDLADWVADRRDAPPDSDGEDGDLRRKVLIVDDNRSDRRLVRLALSEDDSLDVLEAEDGREAVALARSFQPDLVLLDLAMPGMGGLEAMPLIGAVSRGSRIVVLSGMDRADMAERARMMGAVGFMSKDCDIPSLGASLHGWLDAAQEGAVAS